MTLEHLDEAPADERTLPHDVLAEQSALGGMLLSRDGVEIDDVMDCVEPADFYLPKHEIIALAIGRLHTAVKPTDVVAVSDELTRTGQLQRAGGAEYLHTLTGIPSTAANAGYYASIVAQKAVLRRLVEAGTRITQIGYASEGDPVELLGNARAAVDGIAAVKDRTLRSIGDTLSNLAGELEAKPDYIPTGWDSIDMKLGGFAPGELTVIAARPGGGKSIALLQAAMQAARRGCVSFTSLEMTEAELQLRLISQVGEIQMTTLRNHTLSGLDWNRFKDAKKAVARAPVFVHDDSLGTVATIRANARAVAKRGELVMVVVDYLQLVDGEGSDRRLVVDKVARDLKALAKDLNVPVLAAAQLNRGERTRGGGMAPPQLRDLREAGGIENNADNVLLLHRPEKRATEMDVIVAKNRHGSIGTVSLRWQPEYARMLDKHWSATAAFEGID